MCSSFFASQTQDLAKKSKLFFLGHLSTLKYPDDNRVGTAMSATIESAALVSQTSSLALRFNAAIAAAAAAAAVAKQQVAKKSRAAPNLSFFLLRIVRSTYDDDRSAASGHARTKAGRQAGTGKAKKLVQRLRRAVGLGLIGEAGCGFTLVNDSMTGPCDGQKERPDPGRVRWKNGIG
jgi:hypothetical protein